MPWDTHGNRGAEVSRERETWEAYRAKLHRFVLARVKDEAAAEDIVHDVLARAYARRDTLRNRSKLGQWLYQIARNAIVDHYRRRKPAEELPDEIADEEGYTSSDVEKELARCLTPFIEELPAHYRQAVMLAEFQGLTQREVASKLGLSVSGAKSRVQRARKQLEAMLLECCSLEFDRRGGVADYEPKGDCKAC
jgi:RNA polymerase sigma-70 factor (ECF subfamily)